MEDTVAAVLALLFIAAVTSWVSYIVGSLACAAAGLRLGPLLKIGLGFLGVLATTIVFGWLQIRPPGWTIWISAPLLAGGAVIFLRRLRRPGTGSA